MKRNTEALKKNLKSLKAYQLRAIYNGSYRGIPTSQQEKLYVKKELKKRKLNLK